ncbi:MAG: hypothetical protein J7I99_06500, partial [Methanophagales archaeon]|nr:hypothetical protein [Methanophagales archaeon]
MSPAIPQSALSSFNNASNATDAEPGETPSPTPAQSPTPGPTPILTLTPTPPFYIFGWVLYKNGEKCYNPSVKISNLNASESVNAETSAHSNFFHAFIPNVRAGDVIQFNVTDGTQYNCTNHTITQNENITGVLNITLELEPPPQTDLDIMVTNISIDKQTLFDGDIVNITANVTNNGSENVSFSLLFEADENEIGSVPVDEMMPGEEREISIRWNATFGKHNITVKADPGDEISEFNESNNEKSVLVLVNVSRDFAITHISLFNASSGEPCNKSIFLGDELLINFSLNITNLANNGDYVEVALLIDNNTVNRTNISFAGNIRNISRDFAFKWNVNKTGNYTITVCVDPEDRTVEFNESNNNKSLDVNVSMGFDFSVVNVEMPSEAKMGDVVRINATVASEGMRKAYAPVEFYDRKRINLSAYIEGGEIRKVKGDTIITLPWGSKMVDNITIPNARKIRVHFSHVYYPYSLKIYGKDFVEVEDLSYMEDPSYWTKWISGDTIRIESELRGEGSGFSIDMYEALLSTSNVSTDKSEADVSAELNLSMQEMGWALVGTHNITVKVNVTDDNPTNNSKSKEINVRPSLDFALLNITPPTPKEPLLNQTVKINVTAANFGTESGTAVLSVLCDNITVNETEITLNTNATKTIEMSWIANTSNGGAGYHDDVAVKIDPENTFVEMNEENNTLHEHIFVNGTDLVVVSMEIPCGVSIFSVPCYCGENYRINVTIANIGALNASDISIILKDKSSLNESSEGKIFNISHIPYLNSGDHANISVNWTPEFFGKHTITANVSAEYTDAAGMIPYNNTDNNETNNEIFENVSVKPEYDFAVENVSVSPPS